MAVFVWLLLSFSPFGWGLYSFPDLEKCFLATQVGELPGGKAQYLHQIEEPIETYSVSNGTSVKKTDPVIYTHTFGALMFQEVIDGTPTVHIIQDINASQNKGSIGRRLLNRLGTNYFNNVRASVSFPNELSICHTRQNWAEIKVGTHCTSSSGNACHPVSAKIKPGLQGICPIEAGQALGEKLNGTRIRDLRQLKAEKIVRAAIKDRLENLSVALREQPAAFAEKKEEIKQALSAEGSCRKALKASSEEISGLAATTLCALDWRDPEICQQGDIGNSFESSPMVPTLPATFIVPVDKKSGK